MDIKIWWVWIAIAACFVIAEIFHMGFFLLWFGVGAALAGILSLLGFGMGWQLGSFIVVSAVLFAVSRRFAERFTKKQPPGVGADRFIDKKGLVIEEINNLKNTGRVRIGKEEWRADSDTGEVISPGQTVEVIKVEGTHLVVKVLKGGK
ncbi:MAG: NfeD family protein [candidate division Zixibacteria bacterium]|nr:NfeD family protein [candidate division Zixibacteria bacterium]